ncbi:MmgE/PrpD family protein [Nocardia sp. CA-290969]|uniref:MmgE/PrpD family protein n=1 Tax=Nocardia sp. CA-290969 TaxID=3239986 RepID=UPI003D936675
MIDKVTMHAADGIAAMMAASTRPWTEAARSLARRESAAGHSAIIGHAARLRPGPAALVNATAMHGLELDDYHVPAAVHAGCVVVPAGISVAEEIDGRGRDLLTALAVGYEVTIRLGLAMSPEITQDRGFHVTSSFGPLGAAAAAARLWQLDATRTRHALGLAVAQAGGTTEFTRSGGEVKRLHAGFAAAAGIRSAELAQLGATGPGHPIEGDRGFARSFGGRRVELDRLTDGLGETWHCDGLGIKAWSTCTGNHAALAAMGTLRTQGLRAEEVESVRIYTDRTTAAHCGHLGPRARSLTEAQFSLHVTAAMAIALGGNDPSHYDLLERSAFEIPEVTRIATNTNVLVGEEQDRAFAHGLSARVEVTLRNGTQVEASASPPGSPENPYDWPELFEKMYRSAAGYAGKTAVDDMATDVRRWQLPASRVRGTLPIPAAGSPGSA